MTAMTRYDLINWFIKTCDYKSYLEIGLFRSSRCFDHVKCERKWWVDPMPQVIPKHPGSVETSDEYMRTPHLEYDIGFVDGLHESSQVIRDVTNLLTICKAKTVILHDCWAPIKERSVFPNVIKGGPWYGTVWHAWCCLRSNPDLSMRMMVDPCKCGLGIIQPGKQMPFIGFEATWDQFDVNRQWITLPISKEELYDVYASGACNKI
jgi:hypothetical protein